MKWRPAWSEARRAGQTARNHELASRHPGDQGSTLMDPIEEQEKPFCFFCQENRTTKLKVGKLGSNGCLGYGVYCEKCGPDPASKRGENHG